MQILKPAWRKEFILGLSAVFSVLMKNNLTLQDVERAKLKPIPDETWLHAVAIPKLLQDALIGVNYVHFGHTLLVPKENFDRVVNAARESGFEVRPIEKLRFL